MTETTVALSLFGSVSLVYGFGRILYDRYNKYKLDRRIQAVLGNPMVFQRLDNLPEPEHELDVIQRLSEAYKSI